MDFSKDMLLIKSELWLTILALLILITELLIKKKEAIALLSIIALALTGIITINTSSGIAFSGMFVSDSYSMFFKFIFLGSSLLTILLSMRYLSRENAHYGEYYSLLLFSVLGMSFMASSNDLILLYLGTELMALSIYVLAGFKRHDSKSNEAAIKYFLLGAFSSALLLYGISFIYLLTGTTNLKGIAQTLAQSSTEPVLMIALLFLASAFAFKIAAVPFHMWSPDVYEGAPTPVTAFMSVAPKAAGFAIIGRVFITAFGAIDLDWKAVLIVLSVLTMIIGNILAISQTNIKRMLAYSSIAHSGYALLGIIAGTPEGIGSTMLYLLIYAFMNLGAFAIVTILGREGEELSQYEGLAKTEPLWAAIMLIFMFSLTGIPPTAGFVGKFYLFMSVINAGYTGLAVIAVIMSAVSAYFYLRVVMFMYMKEPQRAVSISPSVSETLAVTITTGFVILIGLSPYYFIEFARASMIL
ncbi:MAG: NADH-quinone oxidoreductase subunit N [Thermodesulfovibrionales bacterium]|nr:NADH-quinone oxidoreductase subunit N [Thermodesulfovibrionales bacterium]